MEKPRGGQIAGPLGGSARWPAPISQPAAGRLAGGALLPPIPGLQGPGPCATGTLVEAESRCAGPRIGELVRGLGQTGRSAGGGAPGIGLGPRCSRRRCGCGGRVTSPRARAKRGPVGELTDRSGPAPAAPTTMRPLLARFMERAQKRGPRSRYSSSTDSGHQAPPWGRRRPWPVALIPPPLGRGRTTVPGASGSWPCVPTRERSDGGGHAGGGDTAGGPGRSFSRRAARVPRQREETRLAGAGEGSLPGRARADFRLEPFESRASFPSR